MNNTIPDGYETPLWPSLALPYGQFETRKILYYKNDVIGFTILWSIYINIAICAVSSFFTFISIRKKRFIPIIVFIYGIYGLFTGIINGYLIGFSYWYIVESLEFTVSTFHPLFLGITQGALFRLLEIPNVRISTM
ncbi:hypothetical protein BCR36DRAFT_586065 [Piromyces finnis]|uniref:Uncharacterized protein n=1 Tax=Piromyces finnis TaxID=1754191 RepID=A0A1Y1V2X8_9FUNG|nr:hypothetical protein BCR36DRAFT_586065 [Piromyces finnis]|eukprot:ORX44701.1 hypothetical protein BCR36DRAFT_586065 [Piromyces finnis]